jgi:ACS family allantoate permease-like MFS transporter
VILTLRQYIQWENRRRDKAQGLHIDPETVRAEREDIEAQMIADETDWENKSFRYIL